MQAETPSSRSLFDVLKLDSAGLVAAVIQDHATGQVLMVGYMNREAVEITLRERRACFWSRSRRTLWRKGETSGNVLEVREVRLDCDGDALLVRCEPAGPTCHTNETSCFYRRVGDDGMLALAGDGMAQE
jgi:phosphoribosyl-AMP cyclohydrolase